MPKKYSQVGIIYGWCGSSAIHWQTWLARKTRKSGIKTVYPKLPGKDRPDLNAWLKALEKGIANVDGRTALVGHSLGCCAILHMLKRKNILRVGLVVLVAPPSEERIAKSNAPFLAPFASGIDFMNARRKADRAEIFISDNDAWSSVKDAKKLAKNLRAKLHIIHKGGHLNVSAGFNTFPEVLALIIG